MKGFKLKKRDLIRFWSKIDKGDKCWEWTGSTNIKGYGFFHLKDRNRAAHRIAWMIRSGDIPKGMHVCHRCDNRKCVKYSHLFLGSNQDNIIDAAKKGRLHTKLTKEQVRSICSDPRKHKDIGKEYGVSTAVISEIKNKKAWTHITANNTKIVVIDRSKGEGHYLSKLTEEKVKAIRKDTRMYKEISKDYNVNTSTIWSVKSRRTWKHIK
jgi:uncharacterized protein YerC